MRSSDTFGTDRSPLPLWYHATVVTAQRKAALSDLPYGRQRWNPNAVLLIVSYSQTRRVTCCALKCHLWGNLEGGFLHSTVRESSISELTCCSRRSSNYRDSFLFSAWAIALMHQPHPETSQLPDYKTLNVFNVFKPPETPTYALQSKVMLTIATVAPLLMHIRRLPLLGHATRT